MAADDDEPVHWETDPVERARWDYATLRRRLEREEFSVSLYRAYKLAEAELERRLDRLDEGYPALIERLVVAARSLPEALLVPLVAEWERRHRALLVPHERLDLDDPDAFRLIDLAEAEAYHSAMLERHVLLGQQLDQIADIIDKRRATE